FLRGRRRRQQGSRRRPGLHPVSGHACRHRHHQGRRDEPRLERYRMPPRLATYSVHGSTRYGAVVEGGIVDLAARFGKDYPTLREVIAADALRTLIDEADRKS